MNEEVTPPLPLGTKYDGASIVRVVEGSYNDDDWREDDWEPYEYELSDGRMVWIKHWRFLMEGYGNDDSPGVRTIPQV